MRTIFLLDMDAFFASVEERENPELRGRPVIVVGSASPRSVVCAANYEVRKYGVHSAMPYSQAIRLCPSACVVTAQPKLYREVSRSVFSICEKFTDLLEISSIDECYMEMTPTAERFGGALRAASLLKERIRSTEGVTCTIGIGPNKLLAKLAASMRKPDGLSRITAEDVPALFADLPLSALHGIGEKTAMKLKSMGVTTAGALGSADAATLSRVFGVYGGRLSEMGRGLDDSPVVPYYTSPPAKSVSHEHTLEEDTRDLALLKRTLHYLSEKVAYRLRKKGFSAKTVGLTLRWRDLQRITRSRTLIDPTDDGLEVYRAVLPLLLEALKDPRPVRLVGISAGNLVHGVIQPGLFSDPRRRRLAETVDALNDKLGKMAVKPASLIEPDEDDHITFQG
ncbi:MAG: DNA polymerase IV [Armatimonadota bacterium]